MQITTQEVARGTLPVYPTTATSLKNVRLLLETHHRWEDVTCWNQTHGRGYRSAWIQRSFLEQPLGIVGYAKQNCLGDLIRAYGVGGCTSQWQGFPAGSRVPVTSLSAFAPSCPKSIPRLLRFRECGSCSCPSPVARILAEAGKASRSQMQNVLGVKATCVVRLKGLIDSARWDKLIL